MEADAHRLARRHGPWLLGWFRLRGVSDHEAEELAQEVLLRLIRNLPRLRDERAVPAWLRRAAGDLLARHARRRRPLPLLTEPAAAPPAVDERLGVLREALAELPGELEDVVLARFAAGLTYEQTAERLGLTRATVQSRLRRALVWLRRRMETEEVEAS